MSKISFGFAAGQNRRLIITAVAIGGIASLAAIAAHFILTEGVSQIAGEIVFGICVYFTIAAYRSRKKINEKSTRLDAAVNHMSQGLLLFDSTERLVLCNRRYIEMYGLSPDVVKPGITLGELLHLRTNAGTFSSDPEKYRADLLAARQHRRTIRNVIEHTDGRTILVINQPMADGGWVATHEDITQTTKAERELRETKTFLKTIIESVPVTIVVKDARTMRYVLVNRAAENLFGIPRQAIIGKTPHEAFGKEMADSITANDAMLLKSDGQIILDERPLVTPRNGTRIVTAKRILIHGPDKKPQYLVGVVDDVTERKRAEARIAYMSHHDDLTKLPNRTAFSEHLAKTLDHAAKENGTFALMCIDLDRFKGINDVFGHALGDELLCEVSKRLQSASEGAFIARLGGDEFTVIVTDPQMVSASALADRLITAFESDFEVRGQRLRVGMSIGVAVYPLDGADSVTLLGNADAALYRAKSEGRGTIRYFAADLDMRLRERRA
ncbi:MAG: diguanylate cyclase, partial [Rhizobiales bacterium]|nr:diguanylate cyclase [Hyphomicrobiales bacterium]